MKTFIVALCLFTVSAGAVPILTVEYSQSGEQNELFRLHWSLSEPSPGGAFYVNGFLFDTGQSGTASGNLLKFVPTQFVFGENATSFRMASGDTVAGANFTVEQTRPLPDGGNVAALIGLALVALFAVRHSPLGRQPLPPL